MISLKTCLMVQSLSPIALLTLVRNFSLKEICENNVLPVVLLTCFVWIFLAILPFLNFRIIDWAGKKQGFQLLSFSEKKEAGLNFFMTMIIPLMIDDVGTIQGAATLFIIVIMMFALLSKTDLYYANPVLTILGYHVYRIQFKSNSEFGEKRCLAIVRGSFTQNLGTVEYKVIDDRVLYMKEMK